MHVHGVRKNAASYEHIDPAAVGNERRVLISELSGKSNIAEKLGEYGLEQDGALLARVLDRVQDLENEGYQFEAAEASFVLLVERLAGRHRPWFDVLGYHVSVSGKPGRERLDVDRGDGQAQGRRRRSSTPSARGTARSTPSTAPCGRPWTATSRGSRRCSLVDYKVRVINARAGTAARVRVVIESKDHEHVWGTVGVSENVIEASWLALVDSFEYKLAKDARRTIMTQTGTTAAARSWLGPPPEEFVRYFRHLADRVDKAARSVSEEQFWTKPFPFGNSIGHLVLHLTGNLNHYIGALIAGTGYVRHREHEFTDPTALSPRRGALAVSRGRRTGRANAFISGRVGVSHARYRPAAHRDSPWASFSSARLT